MTRFLFLVAVAFTCVACNANHHALAQAEPASATVTCIASGGGFLHAQLRGAVIADLNWSNADMQCAGGPRPDGHGVRLTFAGQLPAADGDPPRPVRFIFGIDEHDTAAGKAQVLPTNLTVILEGAQQIYATRGAEHCAVESLQRSPLDEAGSKKSRVQARGYCLGPATNMAGDARILVPTFEFTGVVDTEVAP